MVVDLDVIEKRCERLETLVFGGSPAPSRQDTQPPTLGPSSASPVSGEPETGSALGRLSTLMAVSGSSVGSRDRIQPLLRRLPELETYLAPSFLDEEAHLSAAVKADLVLAHQGQLRTAAHTWERLRSARASLDASGPMAERLDPLQTRLRRVTLQHLAQDEGATEVERRTWDAIADYNRLMGTLSENFCLYDRTVSQRLE
ncbi:hypothetical protein TCAL_14595 [Tigriopus californicus]|uniref:Uncharacterized protein n=1 Tax=Tigriopus californicus TaxID=6832 RepID=A0A553PD64_TIGCA|nr:uncharacterized protein LOC131890886 [Tigriopus californicus]TRY75620.1 hypothetical protein TCAL_14595 [Tigriopus californicus]